MNTEIHLENYIRDIVDFPKKGIIFKDITPLLLSPEATQEVINQFVKALNGLKVDKVVGMESRGFFFGTLLAQQLGVGFIPVRKPGKLPYQTISEEYTLEYGIDRLEMHADAIKKGENILIHDDVLATGGTAAATCRLVERLGGNIVQLSFLMELTFLHGREKLSNYEVVSLIKS
ncbi:adenine phosphoribosyltransferase [Capnocytophaga catalasegens]|uniref:Adenine phosphoribosyltransferase n=1 Tax=Capnocytophaga catalasegens TaxID=1004260 RepID=A0AAV5AY60_9FLAO|nr:adenine phosphoribosyltransferase [Capnocytophaga catalasegens]GIZ14578.1 adenine phosphoribosyltransferase [Capnocytophaga catalasegens]GJM50780.1 adenine phosphoribosyltransferase [Capnocytophaga catalasegens]GJM51933.1 adenine phosphoribosyltransferase [Capnocytophaga catalasegens]